jgi:hypothetical protein
VGSVADGRALLPLVAGPRCWAWPQSCNRPERAAGGGSASGP